MNQMRENTGQGRALSPTLGSQRFNDLAYRSLLPGCEAVWQLFLDELALELEQTETVQQNFSELCIRMLHHRLKKHSPDYHHLIAHGSVPKQHVEVWHPLLESDVVNVDLLHIPKKTAITLCDFPGARFLPMAVEGELILRRYRRYSRLLNGPTTEYRTEKLWKILPGDVSDIEQQDNELYQMEAASDLTTLLLVDVLPDYELAMTGREREVSKPS